MKWESTWFRKYLIPCFVIIAGLWWLWFHWDAGEGREGLGVSGVSREEGKEGKQEYLLDAYIS